MKYIKKFNENTANFYEIETKLNCFEGTHNKSEWYTYLGNPHGYTQQKIKWCDNVKNIFKIHESIKLSTSDVTKINNAFGDEYEMVPYSILKSVINTRFGGCWFLDESSDNSWDMCVQPFSDEWYIVSISDVEASQSFWFKCDSIDGVIHLINDVLK